MFYLSSSRHDVHVVIHSRQTYHCQYYPLENTSKYVVLHLIRTDMNFNMLNLLLCM